MRKSKNCYFHVPQPTFLFPLEMPLRLSRNMLYGWKDNSMLAKSLASCTYLSTFNSFRVMRCLSQCVSPKIAVFTYRSPHFCLPWRRPCDYHAICCMNEKTIDNTVLAKRLAACTHLLSATVSQLFEPQVQKIAVFTYRSTHFCFPWSHPCDYHTVCCMDGKTIQCLPNPSQHVPSYIQ